MQKRKLILSLCLISTVLFSKVEERQSLMQDFDIRGELEIDNKIGSVKIIGSSNIKDKAIIEIIKKADYKEQFEQFDIDTEISSKNTKLKIFSIGTENIKNAEIDLIVTVPASTDVQNKVNIGSTHISNIKGRIKSENKIGSTNVDGALKKVEIRSETGSARITFAEDSLSKSDVKVDSGSIHITNAGGTVKAEAGVGSITLDQRALSNKKYIDLKTNNGTVNLMLPKHINATINAKTDLGTIQSNGLSWIKKEKKGPGSQSDKAHLILGKGYAPIELETKVGNISVRLK